MPHPIELIRIPSLGALSDQLQSLVRGRLWAQVLLGMLLGVCVGIALGPSSGWVSAGVSETLTSWLALPGQLFLGSIQMIVIPLVFASIVRGLASSDNMDQLRKLGVSALIFFVLTTIVAIVIGLALALLIKPGAFLDPQALGPLPTVENAADQASQIDFAKLPDTIANLVPRSPLGAMVNSEMLSVVLFAVVVGIALVSLPVEQSEPLLGFLGSLQQVCMVVVRWAMWLAPIAVFGLMAQLASKLGLSALLGLSVYVLTVIGGLALMAVLLVLLCWMLAGVPPWVFVAKCRDVQLLAFSTSSSAAVMPLAIKTARQKLGVKLPVAQFIIPLGATINMNGTALYQGVATVFLAQVFGLELSMGQLALVVVTAVAASIGSPATPGVGIVILSMVLTAAGVPTAGIGLVMGVDRILDMSRTVVNVTGDLVAATVLSQRIASQEDDIAAVDGDDTQLEAT